MCFMLHHMPSHEHQAHILDEVRRVATKRLVLLEDTAANSWELLANKAWDAVLNVPQGIPVPFTFRTQEEWVRTLEAHGFRISVARSFRSMWPIMRMYTQSVIVADIE